MRGGGWMARMLGVPSVRAIRGAITVPTDDPEAIRVAVLELLDAVRVENALQDREVISAIFTTTADLAAAFPAETARAAGWHQVPLLCTSEIAVPGSMPRCLRLLVHVERPWGGQEVRHVYLREAASLRPDLVGGGVRALSA
jgi:chorismate mutase